MAEEELKREVVTPPVEIEDILRNDGEEFDRVVTELPPAQFEADSRTAFDKAFDMFKDMPKGKGPAEIRDSSTKLALLRNLQTKDADPERLYADSESQIRNGKTSQGVIDTYLQDIQANINGKFQQGMNKLVQTDPSLLTTFAGVQGTLDKAQTDAKGSFATEKLIVQAYAAKTLSQSIRDDLVVENWAGELTKQHFRENGLGDAVWDGISLIFHPMVNTIELRDVGVALDPDFKGSPFESWTKTVRGFQNASPELKKAMFPKILAALVKGHNNNQMQVQFGVATLFNPEFVDVIAFEKGVEIAEAGLLAIAPLGWGFKAINGVKKLYSGVSQMNKMGNTRKAVQMSKSVDSELKQAMDAHPSNWSEHISGVGKSDDGLASAHQALKDEINDQIVKPFREVTKPGNFIKTEMLSPQEQTAAIAAKSALKSLDGRVVKHTDVMEHTSDGFTMKFTVEGRPKVRKEAGELVSTGEVGPSREIVKNYTFTVDQAGVQQAVDKAADVSSAALLGGKILSPDQIFNKFADGIVDTITFGTNQASRLKNSLVKVAQKAENTALQSIPFLSRGRAKKQINELLLAGDEQRKIFTMDEVMSGTVETVSGKISHGKEVYKAYLQKVAFNEEAHGLTNRIVRESLKKLGYGNEGRWINAKTKNLEKRPVKTFDTKKEWAAADDDMILAPGLAPKGMNFARAGAIDIEKAISEQGYKLVEFQQPIRFNNRVIKKGLIPTNGNNGLFDLPAQLLHKELGYVTRIRKPGYFYAKDAETGKTYGVFKNAQNSDNFSARVMTELESKGENIRIITVRDQDFSKLDALDALANQHGGLIYGQRSRGGIFVDDAIEAEVSRLSAGQSMQRMLDNVSTRMALDEFRMGAVRRWQNTAERALIQAGAREGDDVLRAIKDPAKWTKQDLNLITKDTKLKRMLEVQRTWMIDTLKIPTNEEKVWSRFMFDWAGTMSEGKFKDAVVSMGSKNPVSAFKAAVFDPYLGWFNVRQLYIQMQNASLAAGMYPRQALSAVPQAFIQKLFLHMDEGTYTDLLKRSAKGIIPDKGLKDMAVSLEQAKRSGIFDGIQTLDMMGSNLSGFTSGTLDAYRMVAKKGRIFFEQGEQMARLISWNIARKNWINKNPGKAIDDGAIRMIHDDTLRMNMNMQQANAAEFQKGTITGPMTQFFPVQAKMVENVVGGIMGKGRWTRKEAAMATAGQIMFYGTLGVPFVEDATAWLVEKTGSNPAKLQADSPNLHKFINQGTVGVFFNAMGFKNNFSTDANLLMLDRGVPVELMKSLHARMFGDEASIELDAPLFGIIQRTHDAFMDTYNAARALFISPSFATLEEGLTDTLSGFAAITSAWSNARKIRYAYKTGNLLTRRGKIIADQGTLGEISGQSLVAAALGIKLDVEDEYFNQKIWEMDEAKAKRDTMKAIRKIDKDFRADRNFEKKQRLTSAALSEWEDNPQVKLDIEAAMLSEYITPISEGARQHQRLVTELIQTGTVEINSSALAADYAKTNKE